MTTPLRSRAVQAMSANSATTPTTKRLELLESLELLDAMQRADRADVFVVIHEWLRELKANDRMEAIEVIKDVIVRLEEYHVEG